MADDGLAPEDVYVGDFDVVPALGKWAVMHRPSGMVAPADMTCRWLDWTEGRTALAYYGSRKEARKWFDRAAHLALPGEGADRAAKGSGHEVAKPAPAREDQPVIGLADALKASLVAAGDSDTGSEADRGT